METGLALEQSLFSGALGKCVYSLVSCTSHFCPSVSCCPAVVQYLDYAIY